MAILNYSEILPRKIILIDDQPYEVLDAHVFQKQKSRPVNHTKVRNLISGSVKEVVFHQFEKAEEADMGNKEVKYLYANKGEYWFCDAKDAADRFKLSTEQLGDSIKFIKTNSIIDATTFNDDIIGLKYPIKVELKITEAPPAVRGNTSGNATKAVVVETGATIYVPMFINEGDIVRINTESGDYAERVEKA
jgi:elongation factor P